MYIYSPDVARVVLFVVMVLSINILIILISSSIMVIVSIVYIRVRARTENPDELIAKALSGYQQQLYNTTIISQPIAKKLNNTKPCPYYVNSN